MAPELSNKQRSLLVREIGQLLIAAATNAIPSARSRILLHRLRNHAQAHILASPREPQMQALTVFWDEYTELESAIP